ncbi:5'/3'-nucleotidase SurE [Desulfatirhabdium butyrativorans]|uniref:5'/3'-nucleotidase SurE n=1 Tax=Desulfatirhabdium butyrativorans TaxID=340467 RepID=UPI000422319D|nr:5'/3'-nucleotidase SurE [Desulfatirhabdium butyrativorans]
MKILLTNDDGIFSEGLAVLYQGLSPVHRIDVVAPDRERSAVSHGITLHEPLRATSVQLADGQCGYAVNGTPADCVKLSLQELICEPPDIVISGINPGANVGINAHYSGTVAAAREAALNGIPAMAVSVERAENAHYADIVRFMLELIEKAQDMGLDQGRFLNINFPVASRNGMPGIRITRQASVPLIDGFEKRVDPRDRPYYWPKTVRPTIHTDMDQDVVALQAGFISITPMICDMTDYGLLPDVSKWISSRVKARAAGK